jgi:hypothetical protein
MPIGAGGGGGGGGEENPNVILIGNFAFRYCMRRISRILKIALLFIKYMAYIINLRKNIQCYGNDIHANLTVENLN